MPNVYCAGPLFNTAEKGEMSEIAAVLKNAGYSTFLPQRDGLEFAHMLPKLQSLGLDANNADEIIQRAIFSLDVYKLLSWSDAVVANLNGRVPDEGTVVEASLAWHSGKALVLYKADARTILNGSENPMLSGLGHFSIVRDIRNVPKVVSDELSAPRHHRISATLHFGELIATALGHTQSSTQIAEILMSQSAGS